MNLNTITGQTLEISDAVFGREFNEPLVHQVVTAFLANGKTGTKAQKNRSDVRGGGKKPWKQKGTGRARAGTRSSPIWRSGGVTFAAKPHASTQKVNKKMYRAAIKSVLSELLRQDRLKVVEGFDFEQPRTKLFKEWLVSTNLEGSVFLVLEEFVENVYLAGRNLPRLGMADVESIDPVSLVSYDNVVITVEALRKLEEVYA